MERKLFGVRRFVCLFALLSVFFVTTSAFAKKDDFMDTYAAMVIGQSLGENLAGAIDSAAQMPQAAAEAEQQIQDARRKFWETYPDKPGFQQADAEFARQLAGKDIYFLTIEMMNEKSRVENQVQSQRSGRDPNQMMEMGNAVQAMGGRVIDGGIPCRAKSAYHVWFSSVVNQLPGYDKPGVIINPFAFPARLQQAVANSRTVYEKYRVQRDLAEMDRVRRLPSWVKTPRDYVLMLIIRYGGVRGEMLDQNRAAVIYQEMVGVLGEQHVHAVAEKVRQAPKDECGDIVGVDALGLTLEKSGWNKTPDGREVFKYDPVPPGRLFIRSNRLIDVFQTLLTVGSVRGFILGSGNSQYAAEVLAPWSAGAKYFKSLTSAYGDEKVIEVAKRVQASPKRLQDGRLFDPSELGLEQGADSSWAIEALLARANPEGFAQFLVLENNAPSDVSYSGLENLVGKEKLRAVSRALVEKIFPSKLDSNLTLLTYICPASVFKGGTPLTMGTFRYRLLIEGLWLASSINVPGDERGIESGAGGYDNLAYSNWASFAPGARVDVQSSMREGSRKDKAGTFVWQEVPGFQGKSWSLNLDSADNIKVVLSDKRCEACASEIVPVFVSKQWADDTKVNQFFHASIARIGMEGFEPIRNEIVAVGEKRMLATLYEEGNAGERRKVWISDQIPGGVVKVERWNYFGDLRVQVWERAVVSFAGQRIELQSAPERTNSAQIQGRQIISPASQFVCNFFQ